MRKVREGSIDSTEWILYTFALLYHYHYLGREFDLILRECILVEIDLCHEVELSLDISLGFVILRGVEPGSRYNEYRYTPLAEIVFGIHKIGILTEEITRTSVFFITIGGEFLTIFIFE